MLRSLFQCYIRNSLEAVEAYRTAFGAELTSQTLSAEGVNIHTELDLGGQILAISELSGAEPSTGSTIEICIQYRPDEKHLMLCAFEALKSGATVMHAPGPVFYSEYMTEFVDRFGIRWCFFV